MGILLRDAAENFNPQIHTEENSLAVLMNKNMAVQAKSIELYQRFSRVSSFCALSGRVNKGVKAGKIKRVAESIHDNAFRVMYKGALVLPAYSYGAVQLGTVFSPGVVSPDMSGVAGVTYTNGKNDSNIATDTIGSVAIKHDPANNIFGDKFNPNDSFVLGAGLGLLCIILDNPRLSSDKTHYVLNFKTVGPATDFDEAHFDEDEVLTEAGSYFGQGSLRGYQRSTKNRWRINYMSIKRYTLVMTGSARQQKVAWVKNSESGDKRWDFEKVLDAEQFFMMQDELSMRYSKISMNSDDHSWYENYGENDLKINGFKVESGLTAPMSGEGWIQQLKNNAEFAYNPNEGMEYSLMEAMMMSLSNRSPIGTSGNTFVFLVDKIGRNAVDKGLKKLIGFTNHTDTANNVGSKEVMNISTGSNVSLGFEVDTYMHLGNKVVVIEDELLGNPGLFNTNAGVTGSGIIFCINVSPVQGISNFEVIVRSGRELKKKYIDGIHSFDSAADASTKASSGFDGYRIDWLRESMPVLYDNRCSGIVNPTAKFNGGALAGSGFLTANTKATSYIF